jgi:hypothetical protein
VQKYHERGLNGCDTGGKQHTGKESDRMKATMRGTTCNWGVSQPKRRRRRGGNTLSLCGDGLHWLAASEKPKKKGGGQR